MGPTRQVPRPGPHGARRADGREQEINTLVGFGLVDEGVQVRHCRQPVSLSMGKRSPKIRRSRIDLGRPSVQDQVMRGGAGGGVCATVQREGGGLVWAAGDVLHGEKVSWDKSARAGEPQESFATSVTSVTAARQTGRQIEKETVEKADNRA